MLTIIKRIQSPLPPSFTHTHFPMIHSSNFKPSKCLFTIKKWAWFSLVMQSLDWNGLLNSINDSSKPLNSLEVLRVSTVFAPLIKSFYLYLLRNWNNVCCDAEATPKSLMRVMGIHGLTLYHLKSHLQAKFQFFLGIIIFLCQKMYGNSK